MRISEPIETTGVFWLPGQPGTRLSGVLKISESSEITVELAGMFGNPFVTPRTFGVAVTPEEAASDPRRIAGVLQKGGLVTLDRCLWQNTNSSFPSGLSTSTVCTVSAEVTVLRAARIGHRNQSPNRRRRRRPLSRRCGILRH